MDYTSRLINLSRPMSIGQFKKEVGTQTLKTGKYLNPKNGKEVKCLTADGVVVAFISSSCDLNKPVQISLVKTEDSDNPFYLASNPLEMEDLGIEF